MPLHFEKLIPASIALGAVAALVLVAPKSSACSEYPPPVVQLASATVPSDALLVGRLTCEACTTSDLIVQDDTGATVTGSFLAVRTGLPEKTFAFKPETPWDAARIYEVAHVSGANDAVNFGVSENIDEETFSTELIVFADGVSPVECEEQGTNIHDSCWEPDDGKYWEQSNLAAGLNVQLQGSHQGALLVTWSADGNVEGSEYLVGDTARSHRFDGAPEEVCVNVSSLSILDDTNDVELGEKCILTNTKFKSFGIADVPMGNLDELLLTCATPPNGYEDEWCEVFAPELAAQDCSARPGLSCDQALLQCSPESSSGTGGSGGASGDPDTSTETDFGPDDDMSAGCSLSGRASSTSSWWLLLGSLGLALAWRRRFSL